MTSPNQHINEFLEYYYSFPSSPEYAVLIKGAWGSGKTWFIKSSLEQLESEDGKYIYVSLYGLTNYKEIEKIFFEQLHPVLSSKLLKLGSKVAKGLIKTSIKVDLDGDDQADGSVSSSIPDIDLSEYLDNKKGFVLVFDDLERCLININNVLGYLNHFVEHQDFKVIILANEEEILERDKKTPNELPYNRIKEKLIGKTFEVISDFDQALVDFISKVETKDAQVFIEGEKKLISEYYLFAGYNNLRHLKQILWDYERLFNCLSEDVKKSNELLKELLCLFLMYSFEIKSGSVDLNILCSYMKVSSHFMIFYDKDKKDKNFDIFDKYPEGTSHESILGGNVWGDILGKGLINKERINEIFLESTYFFDEKTSVWKLLWDYRSLFDEEFEAHIETVEKSFADNLYENLGEIKQLISLLLRFSEIGIYARSKKQIIHYGKKYIDHLRASKKLPHKIDDRYSWNEAYDSIQFMDYESQEFQELCRYIDFKIDETLDETLPEKGKKVIELMQKNVDEFTEYVDVNNNKRTKFEVPIFQYIDPKEFVQTYLKLSHQDQFDIGKVLIKRYQHVHYESKLNNELEWLRSIRVIF